MKTTGTKAAAEEHSELISNTGVRLLDRLTATRTASLFVVAALICALLVADMGAARAQVSSGNGVAKGDVQLRDDLIADQESLLNTYRCLYNIDTHVVPGGCAGGKPVQGAIKPGTFTGTPSQQDISVRDMLIVTQESLLNTYRCLFNVDTQVVPGGCPDARPTETKPEPTTVIADEKVPDVKVTFSSSTYSAKEGTTAQVKLILDKAPDRTVVVPLTAAYQGGATPADFGTLPTSVTFAADETIQTVSFTVTDDQQADPGEYIKFTIATDLPDKIISGRPNQATVTITDTGFPEVTVQFASATYFANEGTTAQLTLTLDKAPNRTVMVPLTTAFQSGASAADFGTLPTSVTFAADETSQTVAFTITDDQQEDPGELLQLAIGPNLSNKVTTGTPSQTTVDIIDTGAPNSAQPVIDVGVFYCADESQGYSQADLVYETNLMNEILGGFYSKESSGLSTLRFHPSGIVTPNLDWGNSTLAAEIWEKYSDPNHTGIRECFYDAQLPDDYQQFLFLVDMIPGKQGAFGSPYFYVPNLRESVGMAVVSTVESQYESSYFCSNDGDIPHRIREQPGNILPNLQSSYGYIASYISCRYIIYWNYLFVIGHELGHSVYDLRHPPGCSIMGRGYTRNDKCPTIHLDKAMQFSNIFNGLYVDCVDREALGWPVVREECSSPPPPVDVSFELNSYAAEEGTSAQVTLELDTVPFRTLTVPLTYTFRGGATAADVGTLPASVTFGPNDTTKTITIPVNDDSEDEVGEGVEISFGTPLPADVSLNWLGAPVQTTVSFTDTAPPTVQASFTSVT